MPSAAKPTHLLQPGRQRAVGAAHSHHSGLTGLQGRGEQRAQRMLATHNSLQQSTAVALPYRTCLRQLRVDAGLLPAVLNQAVPLAARCLHSVHPHTHTHTHRVSADT